MLLPRQLWDWKASADIAAMSPELLTNYGQSADGPWRGFMHAPATSSPSGRTSVRAIALTGPSPNSPVPMPIRTTRIIVSLSTRSSRELSPPNPAFRAGPSPGGPRTRNSLLCPPDQSGRTRPGRTSSTGRSPAERNPSVLNALPLDELAMRGLTDFMATQR